MNVGKRGRPLQSFPRVKGKKQQDPTEFSVGFFVALFFCRWYNQGVIIKPKGFCDRYGAVYVLGAVKLALLTAIIIFANR